MLLGHERETAAGNNPGVYCEGSILIGAHVIVIFRSDCRMLRTRPHFSR